MNMKLATVNKAIAAAGIKLELVKGAGYFYFVALDPTWLSDMPSVMVYRLNDLTAAQWMDEAQAAYKIFQADNQ
jgi:hypothetical protein